MKCIRSIQIFACAILIWMVSALPLHAAENTPKPRYGFWNFGLTSVKHNLKSGEGNELVGNAYAVNVGTGYLYQKWFVFGSLDITQGPFERSLNNSLDVDYTGVGGSLWWGYSAQELDLRHPIGGYGFAFGLNYEDTAGKSLGENLKTQPGKDNPDNEGLKNNYVIRLTTLAITPAVFFSWLQNARPSGNTPELLRTRNEGYLLKLGLRVPLVANYTAKYDENFLDRSEGEGDIEVRRIPQKGKMDGFSLTLTFTSLLGV